MKSGVLTVLALLLIDKVSPISASGWNYEDTAHWPGKCASGKKQSPIALSQYKSKHAENHKPFEFHGYDINRVTITNDGHTIEIRPAKGLSPPELSGGGLSKVYKFDHFHIHWYSEHVMDDIRFPIELHFVHFAKEYGTLENATSQPGGIAVLGVFGHFSTYDAGEFIQLCNTVNGLVKVGSRNEQLLVGLTIEDFLPRDLGTYFRYNGSLTTPGCDEVVIWTVFMDSIPISLDQVKVFEQIHSDHKTTLTQNYRPLQPLNGRTVFLVNLPFPVSPFQYRQSHGNMIRISKIALLVNSILVMLVLGYFGLR